MRVCSVMVKPFIRTVVNGASILRPPINGDLILDTHANVGPGPHYSGRWCSSCNHPHGPAYICITYPESVINYMIRGGWITRQDYDDVAMMLLDGLSDGADVEDWREEWASHS